MRPISTSGGPVDYNRFVVFGLGESAVNLLTISLASSVLLCSLVSGFLFAYAVVIMPGIKNLNDERFIQAFQVTDRIIQNNHPLFIMVWVGSVISLVLCALLGLFRLQGLDLILLQTATVLYLLGVQASTVRIHLPLNNKLQSHEVGKMSSNELKEVRAGFERRWNKSNEIRTVIASCTSLLLIILAIRL